jgi:hypothetical protein
MLTGSSRRQVDGAVHDAIERCGEHASRAYGKTVWSRPSLLRPSFREDAGAPNRADCIIQFAGSEGGQKEFGSRESAA